jgi:hypothetical protein
MPFNLNDSFSHGAGHAQKWHATASQLGKVPGMLAFAKTRVLPCPVLDEVKIRLAEHHEVVTPLRQQLELRISALEEMAAIEKCRERGSVAKKEPAGRASRPLFRRYLGFANVEHVFKSQCPFPHFP